MTRSIRKFKSYGNKIFSIFFYFLVPKKMYSLLLFHYSIKVFDIYSSENKLSQHFKNGGNYTLTIKVEKGQWMCTEISILNSPQDNNIRKQPYNLP